MVVVYLTSGWAPSTFVSSRQQKSEQRHARPEDFMDEEVEKCFHSQSICAFIAEFTFETPTLINYCYLYLNVVLNIVTILTFFTLVLFVFIC